MTILIDLFDWSSPGFQLICLSNEVGFIQEIQSRDYFKHVGRVLLTNLSLAKVIDSKIDTIINWSKSSVIEFDWMNMITKKLSSKQTIGRIWTCDSWLFHVANVHWGHIEVQMLLDGSNWHEFFFILFLSTIFTFVCVICVVRYFHKMRFSWGNGRSVHFSDKNGKEGVVFRVVKKRGCKSQLQSKLVQLLWSVNAIISWLAMIDWHRCRIKLFP